MYKHNLACPLDVGDGRRGRAGEAGKGGDKKGVGVVQKLLPVSAF